MPPTRRLPPIYSAIGRFLKVRLLGKSYGNSKMTPETISDLAQQTVWVSIKIMGPILIAALLVGLLVSMFQAATSIQEQTLTFIPKLAIVIAVLMLAGPGMLQMLIDYFQDLIRELPVLIG
jgi:flagellar biosynthesis protein FliQ